MVICRMKRRRCYAIIAVLLVSILYIKFFSDGRKLQGLQTVSDEQGQSIHEVYDGVQTLLMFIGYPRSGHTLVSSLLALILT